MPQTVDPAAQTAANLAHAEKLLLKEAIGDVLTPEEMQSLHACGWDRRRIEKERRRARAVMTALNTAGPKADRVKAQQALDQAEAAVADKTPKLREKIAVLQGQIADLERDRTQAQREVTERLAAVDTLRRMVPEYVEQRRLDRYSVEVGPINQELAEANNTLIYLRGLLAADTQATDLDALAVFKRTEDEHGERPWIIRKSYESGHTHWVTTIDANAWRSHLQNIKAAARVRDLEQRIEDFEEQKTAAEAEVNQELDFWLNRREAGDI